MGRLIVIILNLYVIYLGIAGGISVGEGWSADKYDDWSEQREATYEHMVVIYWDEDLQYSDEIVVREDLNWSIRGSYGNYSLYSVSNYEPSFATEYVPTPPEGYTAFAGLWTSPYGGTQVVNSAGYPMMSIEQDMILYAVWE